MSTVTAKDGVEIYYKDWGPKDAQPIVFHHGWPLSSDDWDNQMLFFVGHGYRVVGIDRRGHGRSAQVPEGHDMDHYAADAAAVVEHLDLRNAVHIGHSTGGGEATRYVARHGQPNGRVAKLITIGAVPPIMVKTVANPGGLQIEVFDGLRKRLADNRSQFCFVAVLRVAKKLRRIRRGRSNLRHNGGPGLHRAMHWTFARNLDQLGRHRRIDAALDADHAFEAIDLARPTFGSLPAILAVLGRQLAVADADGEAAKRELLVLSIDPQCH
jgi:pimeloyl-ACP methyl ester carboxylesterase